MRINSTKLTLLYLWKDRCNGDDDAENHVKADKELVKSTVRLQHRQHTPDYKNTGALTFFGQVPKTDFSNLGGHTTVKIKTVPQFYK